MPQKENRTCPSGNSQIMGTLLFRTVSIVERKNYFHNWKNSGSAKCHIVDSTKKINSRIPKKYFPRFPGIIYIFSLDVTLTYNSVNTCPIIMGKACSDTVQYKEHYWHRMLATHLESVVLSTKQDLISDESFFKVLWQVGGHVKLDI